jgi:hypothetical protein
MAPEVIKGTQMTSGWMKADVWSLGCTVVEMLTGNLPFAEYENPMTAMYHIASGKSPPLSKEYASDIAINFVQTCCNVDPDSRPTVEDLLKHPFVVKIDPDMTIKLKEDVDNCDEEPPKKSSDGQNVMSSTEMRVILSCDDRERENLHQSPDNSPPPSPPKEDDAVMDGSVDDDSTILPGGLSRNVAKTSLLNSVESLETSTTSMSIDGKSNGLSATVINSTEDEAAALKVLEDQNTPCIHNTSNRKKKNNQLKQFPREPKKGHVTTKDTTKTVPVPPTDSSSSSYIRRQLSKEKTFLSSENHLDSPLSTSGIPMDMYESSTEKLNVEGATSVVSECEESHTTVAVPSISSSKQITDVQTDNSATQQGLGSDSSAAEEKDELSPMNESSFPDESVRFKKRERQVSTDSSCADEEPIEHQHPPAVSSSSLKKNKKMGMSKSFNAKCDRPSAKDHENTTKPLSLAKHLARKLTHLGVETNNCDSDGGGSSTGYCASRGSSSGSDCEYLEMTDDEMGFGQEEKKVNAIRNDTSTPPLYHDKGNDWENKKSSKSKKKSQFSSQESDTNDADLSSDSSRPVAPFTSEKLFLHNNLGADKFSRAAQGGAAAIRKEAALSLNTNHQHSVSKYSGYHAASKNAQKNYTSYKKGSKRSKSANVGQTGSSKLVLPSLLGATTVRNGDSGGNMVVVPQLALRAIQSAPTVTRSLNLPPLVKSKTPSNKKSKMKNIEAYSSDGEATVFRGNSNSGVQNGGGEIAIGGGGKDLFAKSMRFVSEEAEKEGGILAPRKE